MLIYRLSFLLRIVFEFLFNHPTFTSYFLGVTTGIIICSPVLQRKRTFTHLTNIVLAVFNLILSVCVIFTQSLSIVTPAIVSQVFIKLTDLVCNSIKFLFNCIIIIFWLILFHFEISILTDSDFLFHHTIH